MHGVPGIGTLFVFRVEVNAVKVNGKRRLLFTLTFSEMEIKPFLL